MTLSVDLGPAAVNGCYLVTEVRSVGHRAAARGHLLAAARIGMQAVRAVGMHPGASRASASAGASGPDAKRPVQTLRYEARVVNNGSFRWEPALVQSTRAPQLARLSTADTLVIGSRPARSEADPSD